MLWHHSTKAQETLEPCYCPGMEVEKITTGTPLLVAASLNRTRELLRGSLLYQPLLSLWLGGLLSWSLTVTGLLNPQSLVTSLSEARWRVVEKLFNSHHTPNYLATRIREFPEQS